MKQNSECGGCGSKEQRLLHHVRHRGNYRRLCTSCVLKHHIGSFCPHCFEIYEGFTPPVDRVSCLKCDSPSHLGCVSKDVVTRYLCPSCLNPGHVYFDVGGLNKKKSSSCEDGEEGVTTSNHKIIDTKLSKILLTAAQFASVSMKKAAAAAKIEADKRVKEAWLTRKRAREALQDVYTLALKKPKKDGKGSMTIQHIPSPVAVEEPMQKPKGNSAVAAAVAAQRRIQNQASIALIERNDSKVKPVGFHAPHVVQRPPTNGAQPSFVNSDKLKVSPTTVMAGHQQFRNAALVNGKDKSLNISQLRINDAKVENENNGLLLVPKTEGLLQHPQINHPIKEDPDELKEFGDSRMLPQLTQSKEESTNAFISRNNEGVLRTGSSKTMS